jgi:hypothetical protein
VVEEEEGPPYRIGESRTVHHGGARYECFDLPSYLDLLRLDVDFHYLDRLYPIARQRIEEQEGVIAALLRIEVYYTEQLTILRDERDRLVERWEEENRLRLEAENTPSFIAMLGWGVTLVLAVVSAALTVVIVVGR